jgi:plastocyanin
MASQPWRRTMGGQEEALSRSRTLALVGAAALLLVSAAPIVAQDEAASDDPMDMEGLTLDVGGVEYAFTDLPTSVPVGTTLTFTNNGAEVHEMVLLRIADGVTESLDELLAMEAEGRDPMEEGLVEMVGDMPLFAAPGTTAEGSRTIDSEGRYVVICFIPQGLTDMSVLEQLGPDASLEDLPPEVQAIMANPPHFALGMIQEFTVTPAGTEVGPLPEAASHEMAPEGSAPADEEAASE